MSWKDVAGEIEFHAGCFQQWAGHQKPLVQSASDEGESAVPSLEKTTMGVTVGEGRTVAVSNAYIYAYVNMYNYCSVIYIYVYYIYNIHSCIFLYIGAPGHTLH